MCCSEFHLCSLLRVNINISYTSTMSEIQFFIFFLHRDAKHMAHDVDKALEQILIEQGKLDSQAAINYLKRLRSKGRYSCDVWS